MNCSTNATDKPCKMEKGNANWLVQTESPSANAKVLTLTVLQADDGLDWADLTGFGRSTSQWQRATKNEGKGLELHIELP